MFAASTAFSSALADFSIAWSNGREANPNSDAIVEPIGNIACKVAAQERLPVFIHRHRSLRVADSAGFRFPTLSNDGGYIRLAAETLTKAVRD